MEPSEGRFETAIPKIIHRDLGKIQNDDACVKDIVDFLRIIRLSRGVVVAAVVRWWRWRRYVRAYVRT